MSVAAPVLPALGATNAWISRTKLEHGALDAVLYLGFCSASIIGDARGANIARTWRYLLTSRQPWVLKLVPLPAPRRPRASDGLQPQPTC